LAGDKYATLSDSYAGFRNDWIIPDASFLAQPARPLMERRAALELRGRGRLPRHARRAATRILRWFAWKRLLPTSLRGRLCSGRMTRHAE
jgi:hypothetical protein